MNPEEYLLQMSQQLTNLTAYARQINEVDLAACMFEESRGMQDAGWSTAVTAHEVYQEMLAYADLDRQLEKSELRILLCLYAHLSEAGGVYESFKNLLGVIKLKPFNMWPFSNLVRVRENPRRVIAPNANATFRDLAAEARSIGMNKLSELLEFTFRDDIRNSVSHADYIIWRDGLRLRNRNGGNPQIVTFEEVENAINNGMGFFGMIKDVKDEIAQSFNPSREVVGRFSANFPMRHTIAHDPERGAFSISSSAPGPQTSPEFERQERINNRLGGKVLALYAVEWADEIQDSCNAIEAAGFEPQTIVMSEDQFNELLEEIDDHGLWDPRDELGERSQLLINVPWGFRWWNGNDGFEMCMRSTTDE
jgi:hypothetical protein